MDVITDGDELHLVAALGCQGKELWRLRAAVLLHRQAPFVI